MKTRVAIYYHTNFGRNDGPPLYYYNALKTQFGDDIEVMHLAPEGDTAKFGKFDLHFWIDYGEDGLPVDHDWQIPNDGGKTVYVCSDAHIDETGKQYRFETAKKFDYAFFNQIRAFEDFTGWKWGKSEFYADAPEIKKITNRGLRGFHKMPGKYIDWLPHAAEPAAFPHFEIVKKYDICFIGHVQETPNYQGITRVDFLDYMFKAFPNFYFGTRNPQKPTMNMFEDASKKFCQSKVVLNISITDDINMRFFEVLSSGSFLLTNWLPTLEETGLIDGVHYVSYKTLEEAKEKSQYYIEHDEEREKIAEAGHKAFLEGHTYKHRIQKILDIVIKTQKGD